MRSEGEGPCAQRHRGKGANVLRWTECGTWGTHTRMSSGML